MAITVRVVARGKDNGVELIVIKTFSEEKKARETDEKATARILNKIKSDQKDFIRDAERVAMSEMEFSIGLVR